jgi:hypothetical protein
MMITITMVVNMMGTKLRRRRRMQMMTMAI